MKKAMKYCASSEWVHSSITPYYALNRDIATLLAAILLSHKGLLKLSSFKSTKAFVVALFNFSVIQAASFYLPSSKTFPAFHFITFVFHFLAIIFSVLSVHFVDSLVFVKQKRLWSKDNKPKTLVRAAKKQINAVDILPPTMPVKANISLTQKKRLILYGYWHRGTCKYLLWPSMSKHDWMKFLWYMQDSFSFSSRPGKCSFCF